MPFASAPRHHTLVHTGSRHLCSFARAVSARGSHFVYYVLPSYRCCDIYTSVCHPRLPFTLVAILRFGCALVALRVCWFGSSQFTVCAYLCISLATRWFSHSTPPLLLRGWVTHSYVYVRFGFRAVVSWVTFSPFCLSFTVYTLFMQFILQFTLVLVLPSFPGRWFGSPHAFHAFVAVRLRATTGLDTRSGWFCGWFNMHGCTFRFWLYPTHGLFHAPTLTRSSSFSSLPFAFLVQVTIPHGSFSSFGFAPPLFLRWRLLYTFFCGCCVHCGLVRVVHLQHSHGTTAFTLPHRLRFAVPGCLHALRLLSSLVAFLTHVWTRVLRTPFIFMVAYLVL